MILSLFVAATLCVRFEVEVRILWQAQGIEVSSVTFVARAGLCALDVWSLTDSWHAEIVIISARSEHRRRRKITDDEGKRR